MSPSAAFDMREGVTTADRGDTNAETATALLMMADFSLLNFIMLSLFFQNFLPIICLKIHYTGFREKIGYKTVTEILQFGEMRAKKSNFSIVRKKRLMILYIITINIL